MIALRVFLLLGLILHKAVWIFLKPKEEDSQSQAAERPKEILVQAVKLVKSGVLAFLLVQTAFLDLFPIMEDPTLLRIIGTGVYIAGLSTAIVARINLGQNWVDLEEYQVLAGQSVVDRGIYRYVRHPIYTGDILLLIGLQLALNSWLVLGVVAVMVVVYRQAVAEESLLSEAFPQYKEYCLRTKRFVPFLL